MVRRWSSVIALAAALWCAGAGAAQAGAGPTGAAPPDDSVPQDLGPQDSGPDGSVPDDSLPEEPPPVPEGDDGFPEAGGPLIVVPAGCASPPRAVLVFTGEITSVSTTAARFRVERVLAGTVDDWAVAPRTVDVVYGEERRFLAEGERYVVGAAVDPGTGSLRSAVRAPEPMFGGDAVIGLDDSDVECPRLEDPVRTLHLDGTAVDSGVLTPLDGQGDRLARAVLLPVGIAFVVLAALVLLKHTVFAVGRSLRDLGAEPAVAPTRHRRHSAGDHAAS